MPANPFYLIECTEAYRTIRDSLVSALGSATGQSYTSTGTLNHDTVSELSRLADSMVSEATGSITCNCGESGDCGHCKIAQQDRLINEGEDNLPAVIEALNGICFEAHGEADMMSIAPNVLELFYKNLYRTPETLVAIRSLQSHRGPIEPWEEVCKVVRCLQAIVHAIPTSESLDAERPRTSNRTGRTAQEIIPLACPVTRDGSAPLTFEEVLVMGFLFRSAIESLRPNVHNGPSVMSAVYRRVIHSLQDGTGRSGSDLAQCLEAPGEASEARQQLSSLLQFHEPNAFAG